MDSCGGSVMKDGIQCEILRNLYDFWESKCRPDRLPSIPDIDPHMIPDCLPYVMIMDVVGEPRRFRFRLAGTAVEARSGQFRTGRYLDEIDLGQVSEETLAMMHGVVDERLPSFHQGRYQGLNGEWLQFERIAMPLSADGDCVDAILVGIEYVPLRPSFTGQLDLATAG